MAKIVLGLDIGGANLKAATSAGRALSVPFAVWKHPEKLGDELAKLINQFPEADELAVTMTAELCDCYETKREGVRRIVNDVVSAVKKQPILFWSTEGKFVSPRTAISNILKVAAANWHALATFSGRFVFGGDALLVDMGTTTTDIIPIKYGRPNTAGLTDVDRMTHYELLYMGWKRTPATSVLGIHNFASEFFATCQDAHIVLKSVPEDPNDTDTADGRPATLKYSMARLARMQCGDIHTIPKSSIMLTAEIIYSMQCDLIRTHIRYVQNHQMSYAKKPLPLILSGSGIFVLQDAIHYASNPSLEKLRPVAYTIRMIDEIGEELSACAPAYAVAVLSAEGRA